MGEGLALSLYIIYNICGLHSESGCSPHCLSLHGSNVFPEVRSNGKRTMMSFAPKRLLVFSEERSNDKGAMMSFAPKRPDVFPEGCSNGKRAMMSFAPKRPDVFPWERSCISWTVMLLVSSQVWWALEAVFWWPGRLPPGGGKDVAVVLRSVSPGAWKTVLRAGEWGLAAQAEAHAYVQTEVGGLVLVDGGYAGVVLEVVADAWLGI